MPIKDDDKRRTYFREYMRKRRVGKASPKQAASAQQDRVRQLETENAELRARIAELEKSQAAHPVRAAKAETAPEQRPKPAAFNEAEMRERIRADREAYQRELAQYGGRRRENVVDDIRRLLTWKGHLSGERVIEAIINALLPHVAQQDNIERGIPHSTYRKVLGGLHGPTGPMGAARDAFEAFKGLRVKRPDGQKNSNSIVIADDKVTTMADYWRKQQERRDKARAAAAARRQSKR
jgi:hypothetical protein